MALNRAHISPPTVPLNSDLHSDDCKLCTGPYTLVNHRLYVVQTLTVSESLKRENFTAKQIREKNISCVQNADKRFEIFSTLT